MESKENLEADASLVSVMVPVYNVERYLPQCVDSILAQDYQNLDILLVDDGSTDGCGAMCDSYSSRDPRVRVLRTQNHGLAAARNTCVAHARPTCCFSPRLATQSVSFCSLT